MKLLSKTLKRTTYETKDSNAEMKMFSWPYEFPGAYWLDEKEEKAVLDVLRNGSLFRYYGLNKPSFADKFEAMAVHQVDYVVFAAGEEVVKADDVVPFVQEAFAEV